MPSEKFIIIFFILTLFPSFILAQTISIYNEKTNQVITEENFHIDLPKINNQISTQKAKATLPITSNKNKLESNLFQPTQLIDLTQEQVLPWGIERVRAPYVWDKVTGNTIKVAILDSGIDYNHPDLNVAGGISFIDDDYTDYVGHGTAVAGIISAIDNEIGVIGVSPEIELYSVKVMNEEGGYLSDVLNGIDWAIKNDMDIISMSFGTPTYSQALEYKLAQAYEAGIILIAASGNTEEEVWYPAKHSTVIAVGNTDINNDLFYSNYGNSLELVAPGTDILTTYLNNEYVTGSGTSFSAPHVAGVVALILDYNSLLSIEEVRMKLSKDAIDLGDEGKDNYFGYGLAQIKLPSAKIIITMPEMSEEEYSLLEVKIEKLEVWQIVEGEEVFVKEITYNNSVENYTLEVEPGDYKIKRYINEGVEEELVSIEEDEEIVIPLYTNTQQKDFVIDAPWRIEPGKDIPLLLLIHDANLNAYPLDKIEVKDSLSGIVIYTFDYSGDTCNLGLFSGFKLIDEHLWYEIKSLDPDLFWKDDNDTIHINVRMHVKRICGSAFGESDVTEDLMIKIDNKNLPKFNDWYCGDTHYHSIYTDTSWAGVYGELGAPINATIEAGNALGMDWVIVTDHSNSLTINENWEEFVSDCNNFNKCLVGEEINCDYGSGNENRNHYLGYNLINFQEDINPGSLGTLGIPETRSCEEIINNINLEGGFGYVAHPYDSLLGGLAFGQWSDYSLLFTGLEIWNEAIIDNVNNELRLDKGLNKWKELILGGRKVFISAGSDAHGHFNFKEDYLTGVKSETGFGRAMTCCHSQYNPQDQEFKQSIFSALKNGNCYLGNNGALNLFVITGFNGELKITNLGEEVDVIDGTLVGVFSTYDAIDDCTLKVYKGVIGEQENLIAEGLSALEIGDFPTSNSYYRAECISPDNKSRIYTNPIWVNVLERVIEPNVYINEVELNPYGNPDTNEWVELYSYGSSVNLDGWYLTDNQNNSFPLPNITINDFYVFDEFPTNSLMNTGDNITLFDNNNILRDNTGVLSDGDNNNQTQQRVPDGDGNFIFQLKTKEAANDPETIPSQPEPPDPDPEPDPNPEPPTIDFTISPSLNFNTIKPGQQSNIINSTITINQPNNQNFTLNINLDSDPKNIFTNIFFDLNQNQNFEPSEQLNNSLIFSITDTPTEQTINIPAILKIPTGFLPGQHTGSISYIVTGEIV